MVKSVADLGVDYVIIDMLNFRGETKDRMFEFLRDYDSNLIQKYEKLYQTKYCDKDYANSIRRMSNKFIRKYKLDNYEKMYSFKKFK